MKLFMLVVFINISLVSAVLECVRPKQLCVHNTILWTQFLTPQRSQHNSVVCTNLLECDLWQVFDESKSHELNQTCPINPPEPKTFTRGMNTSTAPSTDPVSAIRNVGKIFNVGYQYISSYLAGALTEVKQPDDKLGTDMIVWNTGQSGATTEAEKSTLYSTLHKWIAAVSSQALMSGNQNKPETTVSNSESTTPKTQFNRITTVLEKQDIENMKRHRLLGELSKLNGNWNWMSWPQRYVELYSYYFNIVRIVAAFYLFHTLDNQMRKNQFRIEKFWAVEVALFMLALAPWPYLGHTIWGYCVVFVSLLILLWEFGGRKEFDNLIGLKKYELYESKKDFNYSDKLPPGAYVSWWWHFIAFMHPSWAQFGRMYKWHDEFKYHQAQMPWFELTKHVHKLAWLKAMMYCDMYTVLLATTRIRDVITWWFEDITWLPDPVTTFVSKETWDCYGWWLMLAFLIAAADHVYYKWCVELKTSDFFLNEISLKCWGFESQLDRHSDDLLKVVFLVLFVWWPMETFVVVWGRMCIHCTGTLSDPEVAKRRYANRKLSRLYLFFWLCLVCFKWYNLYHNDANNTGK